MIFFKHNRPLQALVLLMLLSAFLHMVVLALHFLITLDYTPFNFFSIIGLNIFYPNFVASPLSGYLSVVVVISIYFLFLFILRNRKD